MSVCLMEGDATEYAERGRTAAGGEGAEGAARKSQQPFVEQQRRRIQRFQDEEVAGRISLEAFKATKREVGVEMRQELAAAYMKNQVKAARLRRRDEQGDT